MYVHFCFLFRSGAQLEHGEAPPPNHHLGAAPVTQNIVYAYAQFVLTGVTEMYASAKSGHSNCRTQFCLHSSVYSPSQDVQTFAARSQRLIPYGTAGWRTTPDANAIIEHASTLDGGTFAQLRIVEGSGKSRRTCAKC